MYTRLTKLSAVFKKQGRFDINGCYITLNFKDPLLGAEPESEPFNFRSVDVVHELPSIPDTH